MRLRETSLRRAEQEVDSLGFRNKQLEHRVAALQDDLNRDNKKSQKNVKGTSKTNNISSSKQNDSTIMVTDPVFTEELQKKIIENAQLVSLVSDKNSEIQLFTERIAELEQRILKKVNEQTDVEKKLRKDLDQVMAKNAALETCLADSTSIIGSDDTLSVSESDHNTPIHHSIHQQHHHHHQHQQQQQHNNHHQSLSTIASTNLSSATSDCEKIAHLEKELFNLRSKYEFSKICDITEEALQTKSKELQLLNNGPSSIATSSSTSNDNSLLTKEQLLFNHFSKKMEDLFADKCISQSKVISYVTEVYTDENQIILMYRPIIKSFPFFSVSLYKII